MPIQNQQQITSVRASTRPDSALSAPERDRADHKLALERFRKVCEYESDWRRRAMEELDFADGLKHWDADMKKGRAGRPCLTFDRITPSVDQVINNMRQAPPECRYNPIGSAADPKLAEITQGLSRTIDNDSQAEVAVMTAYEHAVKIGRGAWQLYYDYDEESDGFEQKIKVGRIANPFQIYPDPSSKEFDYSDMNYCFNSEDLDKEVFEEEYGQIAPGDSELSNLGDKVRDDWYPRGAVRVAEYYYVLTTYQSLARIDDGTPNGLSLPISEVPEGAAIIDRRKKKIRTAYCRKMTGTGWLEEPIELPTGGWIPIPIVTGREKLVDGKRRFSGMIRPAMDSNLAYDFARSKEAEAVGLAPISQWLVAGGQTEGYEEEWASANRSTRDVLHYNVRDINGQLVQAPIRISPAAESSAIAACIEHADNDIKSMLSTWDPSLGSPGPEQSGRAINLRQRQGDNAHFHFADNLKIAMIHDGRIRAKLMRAIYSEEQVLTITGADQKTKPVTVNADTELEGVKHFFDIKNLNVHVTVGTGPSYQSKRQQQTDSVLQIIQSVPSAGARVLDLTAQLLDLPQEFIDRLRPPDIAAQQQNEEGAQPIPQAIQQRMIGMQQMIEAATKEVERLSSLLATKKLQLESQERIAAGHDKAGVIEAALRAKSSDSQALLIAETGSIEHRLDLLHENVRILADSQETAPDDGSGATPEAAEQQPQGASSPAASAGAQAQAQPPNGDQE